MFVFMSWLLSVMISKELEIQLEENSKRDRFVAKFRVLASNYFRSEESLFEIVESKPWQITEYTKNYINQKKLVFDFINKQTDKYLFLYDKLKDFVYVFESDSVNIPTQIWCFDDIILLDSLMPRNDLFLNELIKKIETIEQINYIRDNTKKIKIQKEVIKKIFEYLGINGA